MRIEPVAQAKVPQTEKELIEEHKKSEQKVRTTLTDMVDVHNHTVKEGQKRRKAFYEMKDLKKKTQKDREKAKDLIEEDWDEKKQRQELLAQRRYERESKWRRMTEKVT